MTKVECPQVRYTTQMDTGELPAAQPSSQFLAFPVLVFPIGEMCGSLKLLGRSLVLNEPWEKKP